MTLHRNIFFDKDTITENSTIKLSYTGSLFQNGADEVFVHYGFGLLWADVGESQMIKTETGFETEISVPNTDLLNFCFRDNNSNWDNNECHNYSFEVEKNELSLVKTEETALIIPKLSRAYLFGRKLKLAFYKIVTYLPKIVNGTYIKKSRSSNINMPTPTV